ncbi:MAG TPA: type 4a pilus biogenesis protein PilO [Gemmatimonadaceae bacterium]|nr:type 4a pilus biogenesis protein PilO [Gemmatimonadaceae bacterium]
MALSMPKGQREQSLIFVAFLAIVGAAAYWYFLFAPKSAELAEQQVRLERLATENQKARAEMAKGNLEQLRTQLKEYAANLDLLRALVPTSNEVPALLEQVSSAARREGLDLAAVDPQPVITGELYDTYRYELGVIGSYHELGAFLSNVGSLQRIVAPVNLRLTPRAAQGQPGTKGAKPADRAAIEARFQIQAFVARKSVLDDDAAMPITTSGGN